MSDTRIEKDALGEVPVPAHRLWGAQTQRSVDNFPDRRGALPLRTAGGARVRAREAGRRARQRRPRRAARRQGGAHRPRRAGSGRRPVDDEFPLVVFQTGSGTQSNMNANEVIANRAIQLAGGDVGSKKPVHPERRRQPQPVVERRVPRGDAHRHGGGARPRAPARDRAAAQHAGRQGARVRRRRHARAHAFAGRHARHARPGDLGGWAAQLTMRRRHAQARDALASARDRRHRGRHRPQRAAALRRARREAIARATGKPFASAREQVRRALRARRDRQRERRAAHARRHRDEDRQRRAPVRERAARGLRRDHDPRQRAGLVDHAGQGQPDAMRSADDGRRAGVRQRHRGRVRRARRATSS